MADRIATIKECDRLGCRRRKDVRSVSVSIGKPEHPNDCTYLTAKGDLCPYHFEQLVTKVDAMFNNTKAKE